MSSNKNRAFIVSNRRPRVEKVVRKFKSELCFGGGHGAIAWLALMSHMNKARGVLYHWGIPRLCRHCSMRASISFFVIFSDPKEKLRLSAQQRSRPCLSRCPLHACLFAVSALSRLLFVSCCRSVQSNNSGSTWCENFLGVPCFVAPCIHTRPFLSLLSLLPRIPSYIKNKFKVTRRGKQRKRRRPLLRSRKCAQPSSINHIYRRCC